MKILQHNNQADLFIDKKKVKAIVEEIFVLKNISFTELIIHFVTQEEISRIHKDFFNDPTPTDCITFPIREKNLLGEVFICPLAAIEYSPEDPYKETTLYLVHTILHLIGYNDIDPKEEIEMRKGENEIMDHLIKKNLVLSNQIPAI